ncbi:hypothetical protein [Lacihabitans lacunae]|uniref:Uncharacterized protein n=1 Tax=Lacihabitans lacunae TaxID=1028214 RepID=A0ABV7YT85_9BACT
MSELETVIVSNKDVSCYSQLIEKIQNSKTLTKNDIHAFDNIWKTAIDFKNWSDSDLVLGCKITHQRLKDTFKLTDESISIIVRVASYDWK